MRRNGQGGFTLVEMMVALALTLVIAVNLAQLYKNATTLMLTARQMLIEINTVRSTVSQIGQDLEGLVVNAGYFPANMSDYEEDPSSPFRLAVKRIYEEPGAAVSPAARRLNMFFGADKLGFYCSPDNRHINKVTFYVNDTGALMYRKVFDYRLGVAEWDYEGYTEKATWVPNHGEGLYAKFDDADLGTFDGSEYPGTWGGVKIIDDATLSFRYVYTTLGAGGDLTMGISDAAAWHDVSLPSPVENFGKDVAGQPDRQAIEWLTPPLAIVMRATYRGVRGQQAFVRTFYVPQSKWSQLYDQFSNPPR